MIYGLKCNLCKAAFGFLPSCGRLDDKLSGAVITTHGLSVGHTSFGISASGTNRVDKTEVRS